MRQDVRSGCPVNRAVEAFGDRWSLIVLRDMIFGGKRHFRELLAGSEEGIASNILADRLKRLTAEGLLRRDDPGAGRKATYSLTEPTIQLVPVLAQLGAWGRRHRETTPELAVRAELLERGGPPMWERFMDELRAEHLGGSAPTQGPTVREELTAAHVEVIRSGAGPAPRR